jgi:hypothetical protein
MPKTKEETAPVKSTGTSRISLFYMVGTYPLLMHNPKSMYFDSGGKGLQQKKIPTPEEEAKASRYVTDDGLLYIPTQGARNAIVSGGKGRRVGKQYATTILGGGVFPVEERTLLIDAATGQPIKADQYEIDVRRVVLKSAGGIQRARAKVSNWACKIALELDELVEDNLVVDAGSIAGRFVGLLDYRPECGGPFGRFKISLVN